MYLQDLSHIEVKIKIKEHHQLINFISLELTHKRIIII